MQAYFLNRVLNGVMKNECENKKHVPAFEMQLLLHSGHPEFGTECKYSLPAWYSSQKSNILVLPK